FSLAIRLSVDPAVLLPSTSGVFCLDFGGDRRGYLFVVVELHGEGGAPLAHRAQVRHVAEHVGERHHGVDDIGIATPVLAVDVPAPGVEVADDVAGVFLRRHHFDLHDRLEQYRLAFLQPLPQRRARGNLEGERGGVDIMVFAIDQRDFEIDHRKTREHARAKHGFETLLDARDELLRHRATYHLVFEYKTRGWR